MSVTARFYVSEMTRRAYNPAHAAIKLAPAYRGTENKAWSEATPSGAIELSVTNAAAVEQFDAWMRAGTDIHITFEAAPAAALV